MINAPKCSSVQKDIYAITNVSVAHAALYRKHSAMIPPRRAVHEFLEVNLIQGTYVPRSVCCFKLPPSCGDHWWSVFNILLPFLGGTFHMSQCTLVSNQMCIWVPISTHAHYHHSIACHRHINIKRTDWGYKTGGLACGNKGLFQFILWHSCIWYFHFSTCSTISWKI